MKRAFLILVCIVMSIAPAVYSVDGFAVSVFWRQKGYAWAVPADVPECCVSMRGQLLRYDIQGKQVVKIDTIVDRDSCLVQYPAINFEGTKIAFVRWRHAVVNGKLVDRGQSYISVVNKDGAGLTNLAPIPDPTADETPLDWPAGDWIYYVKPKAAGNIWERMSNDIWRVNVRDKRNEAVVTLNVCGACTIRRFSLSIDGTRMGFQPAGTGGSYICCFPPPGGNTGGACAIHNHCGCNGAVSASGKYLLNYCGDHGLIYITSSDVNPLPGPGTMTAGTDVKSWAGMQNTCAPNANTGCGGETMHWSVNSDKWASHWIGPFGWAGSLWAGANHVLINWIDKKAIALTDWPLAPKEGDGNYLYIGNYTGDFWVDGGAANAGKYEGTDGVWRQVGTTALKNAPALPCRPQDIGVSCGPEGVTIMLPPRSCTVRLIDVNGKCARTVRAFGAVRILRGGIAPGLYLVCARAGDLAMERTILLP